MRLIVALLALALTACAHPSLEQAERSYADFVDAAGAVETIDSGIVAEIGGADRAYWEHQRAANAALLHHTLPRIAPPDDQLARRSLEAMKAGLAYREGNAEGANLVCADAQRTDLSPQQLSGALYECFSSVGGAITFEDQTYARIAALQALEQIEEPARRRGLFLAMMALGRAVNDDNGAASPYRRLIAGRTDSMRASITNAEASLGLSPGEGETWLVAALEAWRRSDQGAPIEPWDFRYAYAGGAREVERCASVEAVRAANERFFADLGAPIDSLNVIQDVGVRPGMSPVDFSDITTTGRMIDGVWRPATVRVSVILQSGGLGASAELAHEFGHVAHFAAMRSRASLLFPDDLTTTMEAIADITGWGVYDPAWQQRYLGCATTPEDGLRARLGPVILDIAWGLFETRLSQNPSLDPNAVWTQITHDYLNIVPHPELSWWAVRGQLVDEPGYMINYALGAFITADLRARIASRIGDFDAGNPRWYAETSAGLLRQGGDQPPAELLSAYLTRRVSPDALLADINRLH
jgi:hypothetical protein